MRHLPTLLAVLSLASLAYAQQPAAAKEIHVMGCVMRGVEAGCLIIKDRRTGKTYQINAANPRPDPARGLVVDLKGQITDIIDFCQQGPVLTEISWNYTRMSCKLGQSK